MYKKEFEKRLDEIELQFSFIEYIDSIEAHKKEHILQYNKNTTFEVSRDLQKILRSSFLLMLYNVVESTIRNCILAIYDEIHDNNVEYNSLSSQVQKIWLKHQSKVIKEKEKNIHIYLEELINNINNNKIIFEDKSFSISGNLDYNTIHKIISNYGFYGRINGNTNQIKYSVDKVKDERNKLAHGNKTFCQSGEIITIREVQDIKNNIINYLKDIIQNLDNYLKNKQYITKQSSE